MGQRETLDNTWVLRIFSGCEENFIIIDVIIVVNNNWLKTFSSTSSSSLCSSWSGLQHLIIVITIVINIIVIIVIIVMHFLVSGSNHKPASFSHSTLHCDQLCSCEKGAIAICDLITKNVKSEFGKNQNQFFFFRPVEYLL